MENSILLTFYKQTIELLCFVFNAFIRKTIFLFNDNLYNIHIFNLDVCLRMFNLEIILKVFPLNNRVTLCFQ